MQPADEPTAPIRIARIITRLNIGGPAIQAVSLSHRLAERGFRTLLIHGRVGPDEGNMDYIVPDNRSFEARYMPALRREVAPAADARAVWRIFRLLCRFQPAIVHTHMGKAGFVGRASAVLYNATAGRSNPARILHTYHGHVLEGYFGARTTRAFTAAERFFGRRSDALIAVSPTIRNDLIDTFRIGRPQCFHVVPLGFDLRPLAAIGAAQRYAARIALQLDETARVVSMIGRLTAIKQPHLFLEMAARVSRDDPAARFLIAGGGELEGRLQAQAAALGIGDRVRFLGWRRDVATVHAASDLLALTSRNEGTPVALIESMAAGVPGVCFNVGGVPDVVTNADLGVLINHDDVAALTAGVRRLLEDDDRRRAMGEHARAWVLQRFGIDRLLDDLSGLYRRLL